MVTRSSLILIFSLAFAFFILAPPFLSQPFPPYPHMHLADVLDLFTPLVLIPLYWLLFTDEGRVQRSLRLSLTFMVFAALWTAGQGMHLSANSIGNLLGEGTTGVHNLIHFYDEVLSHYLWHAGIIGLSAVILFAPLVETKGKSTFKPAAIILAAVLYGFTYFAAINEGGTVPIGLPAALLIPLVLLLTRRRQLRTHNLIEFFFLGYLIALLFFIGWFLYWGGFPQFSQTGIL